MNKKLYIGSLSYETTDDELRELFSGVGTVVSAEVFREHSETPRLRLQHHRSGRRPSGDDGKER